MSHGLRGHDIVIAFSEFRTMHRSINDLPWNVATVSWNLKSIPTLLALNKICVSSLFMIAAVVHD